MLTLTEPQIWVLIGVFAAAIFSMIGIVMTSFTRTLTQSFARVDTRIDSFRDVMDARFEAMNVKFDLLDRDIQALSRRVFGTDPS
ncbi:MAG TPA: hypothetical protein VFS93_01505 [Terrimesophilobacter sp.]|nr:hypothetical protein [Terrimesophilobacter sp.]